MMLIKRNFHCNNCSLIFATLSLVLSLGRGGKEDPLDSLLLYEACVLYSAREQWKRFSRCALVTIIKCAVELSRWNWEMKGLAQWPLDALISKMQHPNIYPYAAGRPSQSANIFHHRLKLLFQRGFMIFF